MKRKITILDISRAAGTSPSTVSRVLTGSASVSATKREAVKRAIETLKYRPNHLARGLKTSVTYTVGLLLNDITNSFYGAVARGVEDAAHRLGYSLILCNTSENADREEQYLHVLEDKQVDGVIVGPVSEDTSLLSEVAGRIPLVQVDRIVKGLSASSVLVDNLHGAYEATRLLLRRGHQHIAVATWMRRISSLSERQAGYARAVDEWGLSASGGCIIEIPHLDVQEAAVVIAQALGAAVTRPTALLALNNQIGLGALAALRQLRLRIPQDVALIVFDDLELFALMDPPITAVEQPAFELGVRAMEILVEQMETPDAVNVRSVVLPTRLIVRESA